MEKTITIENIARACHEANRALCFALGDTSQKIWEQAEDWQKESAIEGVKFRLANPDAHESAQHEAWVEKKRADGWQYGPAKDATQKTHPCLLPYANLPAHEKAKDALFVAVVMSLAPLCNETVSPTPDPAPVTA